MADAHTPTAILLYSGGLDSRLAAEVLLRAGVRVIILRHFSVFFPLREDRTPPLDCPVITADVSDDMVRLVLSPKHGLGSNANPCLDCKEMMYARAWAEVQRQSAARPGSPQADFIATGEVLGQRPMSQRRDAFRMMEKRAGVLDLVVRPLSGQLLPPTIPEQRGLIRREDMLAISGRSRHPQMALAAEWGITDYPSPAGGCRLTEPEYAHRVLALRDMGLLTVENARAIRHGRFCTLGERAVALVGRDHVDNTGLLDNAPPGATVLDLGALPGPFAVLLGEPTEAQVDEARRLVIRHSRDKDTPMEAVLVEPLKMARPRLAE